MSLGTPPIINAAAWSNNPLSDAVLNGQFNPLKNFTNAIDGFTRVSTSAATYTITQNTEVVVYVDASGGNKVVILPAATGQYPSITVKKIDTSFNTVTVTRAGSDTIESRNAYALSPATTTYVLNVPDQSANFAPNGTQWRVESAYLNNRINFQARPTATTAIVSASGTIIPFSVATGWDYGPNFTNATNRFTAPFAMVLNNSGILRFASLATTVRIDFRYFVNGAFVDFFGDIDKSTTGGELIIPWSFSVRLNAGDYLQLYCALITGSGSVDSATTVWNGSWSGITV